ncbi:hypothetical protein PHMEG_00020291 [Phytophthora megakarya]|uniref:PiggyBac transposable element-derived protein domain-containing protein n=1 Tax=Phytophthora megakarya TaxID=4795 RepID=A0A225VS39_9STRA|nr:hypothetical protein PHMEG_00020291 [Phytophthora megakarya]
MAHRRPDDSIHVRSRGDIQMELMAISNHWKQSDEGAIGRGVFGNFMARDRFFEISLSRNLDFSSNLDPRAKTDRAWKIRKVVHVLQRTFRRGFIPPAELASDEAMLPSRSSFNKTRVYMKDKPCKLGDETLQAVLCSFRVLHQVHYYYLRCMLASKKISPVDVHLPDDGVDKKSGPAAVVRNVKAAFPDRQDKCGVGISSTRDLPVRVQCW